MKNVKFQDGKFGLCLSGGGFRAALFHIGTLAALAERELLHKVEVLSTVSGGSIIGAYYYLKVKQLLEGKRPGCPTPAPEHYLDIVQEIERDFLVAVQKNIRMRLFFCPYKTARMLLEEEYSRSDRLSELLNYFFFDCIALTKGIRLNDIHVTPHNAGQFIGDNGKFVVEKYNEAEACKIPLLTINATCLNTGHPFHFTGSWIGEPQREGLYQIEQNSNCILPQLRFDGHYQDDRSKPVADWQLKTMDTIMLSDAVAASAAVPGVFPPLPIHNLYRNSGGDEIVIELSDGGVFDNQGLDTLLAERCAHIIVSDACGQLEDERLLPTDMMKTGLRANDIMMERIRGYGYFDLDLRDEVDRKLDASDPLRTKICFVENSMFTHLRELANNTKDMPALPGPANQPGGVVYRLSAMRTDFDAFSDLEAYTLMYQGYALAQRKLEVFAPMANPEPLRPWRFLEISEAIRHDLCRLTKHLTVSKQMLFKSFRLAPVESWVWLSLLLAPFILIAGCLLCANWNTPVIQQQLHVTSAKSDCCCDTTRTASPAPSTTCTNGHFGFAIPAVSLAQPTTTWGELIVYAAAALLAVLPMSPKVRELFKVLLWLRRLKQGTAKLAGLPVMALSVFATITVFMHLQIFNKIFLRVGKLTRGVNQESTQHHGQEKQ